MKHIPRNKALLFLLALAAITGCALAAPEGPVTNRYDSKCLELQIGEVKGFIIQPSVAAANGSKPWVWYAPTLGKYPGVRMDWMFSRLLKQGYYICGTEVGDSFGSPQSRATYSKFYEHVIKEYGLLPKVCLLPQSRGGLMWYNWAVENPEKVACIGGIYPVCDFTSYPGLAATAKAYDMTKEELTAKTGRPPFPHTLHRESHPPVHLPTRRRPDRPALNKLGLRLTLSAVVLTERHLLDPTHNSPHHRPRIPIEVGHARQKPLKRRVRVRADQ